MKTLEPAIYVVCLGCYNEGEGDGDWFDISEATQDEIRAHFGIKPDGHGSCGHDEYIVHDFQGFGAYKLGEVSPHVAITEGLALIKAGSRGLALSALADYHSDTPSECASRLDDEYHGEAKGMADFAEDFEESAGSLTNVPKHIRSAIDWSRIGQEMEYNGWHTIDIPDDVRAHEGPRVMVFCRR